MRCGVGLACLALAACAGLSSAKRRPAVEVLPPTGTKPHRLSAAEIPADGAALRELLADEGLNLRWEGGRERLRIQYAPLDSRAEIALVERLSLADETFSEPIAFGPADLVRIRSVKGTRIPVGFTLNLLPRVRNGAFAGFSAGAVVRPERGTLLPVLRGDITLSRTGSVLLVGEVEEEVVFACLIRIEIAGTARMSRLPVPREHRLFLAPFRIRPELLTGLLLRCGLPVEGSSGGISVHHLTPARESAIAEGLRLHGDGEPPSVSPATEPIRLGRIRIDVRATFCPREYGYRTVLSRNGTRVFADHPVRDALLLIVWDGGDPGLSFAALIRLRPEGG